MPGDDRRPLPARVHPAQQQPRRAAWQPRPRQPRPADALARHLHDSDASRLASQLEARGRALEALLRAALANAITCRALRALERTSARQVGERAGAGRAGAGGGEAALLLWRLARRALAATAGPAQQAADALRWALPAGGWMQRGRSRQPTPSGGALQLLTAAAAAVRGRRGAFASALVPRSPRRLAGLLAVRAPARPAAPSSRVRHLGA
jgi:hypothetical protein